MDPELASTKEVLLERRDGALVLEYCELDAELRLTDTLLLGDTLVLEISVAGFEDAAVVMNHSRFPYLFPKYRRQSSKTKLQPQSSSQESHQFWSCCSAKQTSQKH